MWRRKKLPDLPTQPVVYPSGICVSTEKGTYRINRDGKRYRIPTDAILHTWAFPFIVKTTEAALKNYPVAVTKLGFRDGSLLNNFADGKVYLVSDGKLRHITSPVVMELLGNPKPLVVSDAEINLMKMGEPLA